jgi:hypothetical protein
VWKGSDIASLDPLTGELVPLFNPRRDSWPDHFRLDGPILEPLTPLPEPPPACSVSTWIKG